MHCEACNHAHDHGWWGDTLPRDTDTHCRVCHVSYPGSNRWGHCVVCHEMFSSESAFSRHQMVSGCPDTANGMEEALTAYAAAQIRDGKRHYLVKKAHEWRGWTYWGWFRGDE